MKYGLWMAVIILLLVAPIIYAQECSAVFDDALKAVESLCDDATRNSVCYGHSMLDATAHEHISNFAFATPGDYTNVTFLQTLSLSSYNLEDETWGVAVMHLQANLPDTLPGQNVTTILFGDVTVNNAVEPLVELAMTATSGVNVRSRPTTNAQNVVASLKSGQEVTATGRLSDSSWIRITFEYDESTTIDGWVSADFLRGDSSTLNIVEPDDALYTPMQAFYLKTGIGEIGCQQVPDNGMLIQTPKGVGQVEININGVLINLGSTIFVQAVPGDVMLVYVVEGLVSVRANGVTQRVPPGSVTIIELDAEGIASGTPQFPIPYDFDAIAKLDPVLGLMPEVIEVPPALAPDEVAGAVVEAEQAAAVASGSVARDGWYELTIVEFDRLDCSYDVGTVTIGQSWRRKLTFIPDGSGLIEEGLYSDFPMIAPGVFSRATPADKLNNSYIETYTVLSPTQVQLRQERTYYCPGVIILNGIWVSE